MGLLLPQSALKDEELKLRMLTTQMKYGTLHMRIIRATQDTSDSMPVFMALYRYCRISYKHYIKRIYDEHGNFEIEVHSK